MNFGEVYAEKTFKHIYIEKELLGTERAQKIISHFPQAGIIPIDHYKDVFNRRKQDFMRQHAAQNLILASKKGRLVYDGAPVCQSFGNHHFFYTSCIMNCVYDCEYCYLKGMYPSGNLVIFLNLEDMFSEVEELLSQFPVYLCVSYDTDLMALEGLTGFVQKWTEFTAAHENLTIEIRTKSGRSDLFEKMTPCNRVIFAYTVSPEQIILSYEHETGHFEERIKAVSEGLRRGFPVRLCFDPMIFVPEWETAYQEMLRRIAEQVDLRQIRDFSVGSFRISDSYLKPMRHAMPECAVVQYPFELDGVYYHYPMTLTQQMERFLVKEIMTYVPDARIFRWEESERED